MTFTGFFGDPIFTDAIKDALGNDPILDQFDIAPASGFYGATSDDYVTGTILTRVKNAFYGDSKAFYSFITGSRGRIFRKSEASSQPFTDTPWGLKVNRSYRVSQAFDADEKFFDSRKSSEVVRDYRGAVNFGYQLDIAVDSLKNVYVFENSSYKIRKIATNEIVTTLAGTGISGSIVDGVGSNAQFSSLPGRVDMDTTGSMYFYDSGHCRIRKVKLDGTVTTFAGTTDYGDVLGDALTTAKFGSSVSIGIDQKRNVIYLADTFNNKIKAIVFESGAWTVKLVAGSSTDGWVDGIGSAARFYRPAGIIVDSSGSIFVADTNNYCVRKIVVSDLKSMSGTVTTVAGNPTGIIAGEPGGFIDGLGPNARFGRTQDVAVDSKDYVYVLDYDNKAIRKITNTAVSASAIVTTLPNLADKNNLLPPLVAPASVTIDDQDNIYVVDPGGNCVRKLSINGDISLVGSTSLVGIPIDVVFPNEIERKDSTNKIIFPYGAYPSSSGRSYGTKCIFRRDRFGQFRDVLEQRSYSKFIRTPVSPVDFDAINFADTEKIKSDKLSGLSTSAATNPPVSVVFVKQKYLVDDRGIGYIYNELINPLSGSSQNLSTEAVSVDAFYDGMSLQR